jgi:predicted glycoside hydrolase/deacetylase ChbG (UPF0249 family)
MAFTDLVIQRTSSAIARARFLSIWSYRDIRSAMDDGMTSENARGLRSHRGEKSAMCPFSLVLCADDYALSPAVSLGILEALEAGRINATSVMTTRPSWPKAAQELHGFSGRAEIGLHVNLTLGAPQGPMPTFAPQGVMPDIMRVLGQARRGRLPEHEVRAEIARQLDAFAEHFGAWPDFVDGHQHVQVFPQIRDRLLDALDERGLAGKIWLRDSGDRASRILRRAVEPRKALAIAFLSQGFAREARRRGYATNDGFAGFSRFDPARDYAADFRRYLRTPGRRHLVMCHPGHCDAELAAHDSVTLTRERELAFLLSDDFPRLLERAGATMARFGSLRH